MALLKQSTARNRVVLMIDSADHVTGKTGLTLTITASKDGGSFASISPTVTELATGFYNLALTTGHSDTLGDLGIHITSAGADPTDFVDQVVVDLPGATVASVTGAVGSVTGAVGSVTGAVGSVTARVTANTDQLAGQTVTAAAGVTFPTSVASPTNITAGTVTTATNVTTVNGLAAGVITAASIATDAIDADALAADAVTEIQSGLSTLTAAGVRTAVGLASANLDTQLAAVQADTDDIQTRLPAALVGGKMDSHVNDIAADAITATAIATDAFGALELAAGAASEIGTAVRTELATELARIDVATSTRLATAGYTTPPTVGAIADQVWDEVLSGHLTATTTGAALNAAGAAGDPWVTSLPGAYGAGTAGFIVGTNIDALISSRTKPADTQAAVTVVNGLAANTVTAAALASDAVTEIQTGLATPTNITGGTITNVTNLTNAPTAGDFTATMKTSLNAATPAATVSDKTGFSLSTAGNAAVADKVLGRNLATGSDGGRMVKDALRSLRNKTSITAGTLTVTEEDDTTTAWTAVVTTAAGDPLTSIDPA